MPPAPTTPRTAAARMLISKRYSQNATISGSTWGSTPQRWTWTGARRSRALPPRAGVDALDRLRGQLAQRAHRVDADGERAGERPEAGDGHEDDDREHDLGEGPDGVEQQADDVRDGPARHVLRPEEAERQREGRADERADPGDLERLDHRLQRVAAGSARSGPPSRNISRDRRASSRPAARASRSSSKSSAHGGPRRRRPRHGEAAARRAWTVRRAAGRAGERGRRRHTSLRRSWIETSSMSEARARTAR